MSAFRNIMNASLKTKLIELIRLKGPLTVSDYMKIVLTNPESGFYMNNDVFGVKGHFTTNPEISQIFGEILGVWILQEWKRFNCPRPLNLVEFGPGRGTLMSDITRTLSVFEQTHNSINIKLIEMSPHLKSIQEETLRKNNNKLINSIEWYTHINAIDRIDNNSSNNDQEQSNGFTAYIAHEYFDALPIHKFVIDPNTKSWRELLIDYDNNQELRFSISRNPSLSTRLLVPENFKGDHLEVCPEAALQLEKVAKNLNKTKSGCMLICDYGFEVEDEDLLMNNEEEKLNKRLTSLRPIKSKRDTFRAFKNHESWPPLKEPGQADLTADVDFGYLKRQLGDKAIIYGSVKQKDFLLKCGLEKRLQTLLDKAKNDSDRKEFLSSSQLMLNEMGERYRFLSLFPKDLEHLFQGDPPAGFVGGS